MDDKEERKKPKTYKHFLDANFKFDDVHPSTEYRWRKNAEKLGLEENMKTQICFHEIEDTNSIRAHETLAYKNKVTRMLRKQFLNLNFKI